MNEKKFPVKHLKWFGIDLEIENPAGSVRSGISDDGRKWSTNMIDHYGRIPKTEGLDGDMVDVFVKSKVPQFKKVFKVSTKNPETGEFDESKWMLGYQNQKDAQQSFLKHYDRPEFFGHIEEVPFEDFQRRIHSSSISEMISFRKILTQLNEYSSIDVRSLTWSKDSKTFSIELSDLKVNKLPMEFKVYNRKTGNEKIFRFVKVVMDQENEVTHWLYKSGDLSLHIYND